MQSKSAKLTVREVLSEADLAAIKKLFWSYGISRGFDAAMGDFKTEIAQLPYKYVRPTGCLLLGIYQGQAAGCVAYQYLEAQICEMKRLYVQPSFRGLGIGGFLVEKIVAEAISADYQYMRLDTFAYYEAAIHQYQKAGFYKIPPYQKYDMPDVLFYEKKLTHEC